MRVILAAMATTASLISSCAAHSWIEQLTLINPNGSFTGNPGYVRNFIPRSAPGFSDPQMVHILPTDGQPAIEERDIGAVDTMNIKPTDAMCKKVQQQQVQSAGFPRLSAAPGSMVALRYEENGHVTLPQNQPGKPPNRGTVYVYGTTQPKPDENFLDVFNKWTADGSGGDKRGKLLATQPFDDGQCYQVNSGQISGQRQKQFPHDANQLMGADLWCQNDIQIPTDAPSGKPYTLYWVWDWPTEPNVDPNIPNGKAEVYTTCMDIDIQAPKQRRSVNEARAMQPQNINNAAIPSYVSQMMASSTPPAAGTPAPAVASSAPAPQVQAPVSSQAPPQAQTSLAPKVQTIDISAAASALKAEIVSEVVQAIAADQSSAPPAPQPHTVTVTQAAPQVTVYVTAPAQGAGGAPPSAASSAPKPTTAPSAPSQAAGVNQAPQMPPSSLDIQPPQGLFSGTATPASAVPNTQAPPPASQTVAAASAPSGNAPMPSKINARTCSKCKMVKRSRILGPPPAE